MVHTKNHVASPQTTNRMANINDENGLKYSTIQNTRRKDPPWYNLQLIKNKGVEIMNHKYTSSIMYFGHGAEMAQLKVLPPSK